jgi:GGDEF domain-containing protein
VSDEVDKAPKPARSKSKRARRFVMPAHHPDDRTAERIEAFFDGSGLATAGAAGRIEPDASPPEANVASGAVRRTRGTMPVRTLLDGFDTRADWLTALRQESARVVRYGRPAAVVIVDLSKLVPPVATDRYAREVMTVIRDGARETDRGARMTTSRIQVLLPETTAREAQHVAKRISTGIRDRTAGRVDPSNIRIEIASARRDVSLEDALADAERRLAG